MAYISRLATPAEDVQNVITQTGENAKQAIMWFMVIGLLVAVIMFSGKK